MKKLMTIIITLSVVFLTFLIAFAHPGRTDENGGHWDHDTGYYHYHNGEYEGIKRNSDSDSDYSYDSFVPPSTEKSQPKQNPSGIRKTIAFIFFIILLTVSPIGVFVISLVWTAVQSVIDKIKSKRKKKEEQIKAINEDIALRAKYKELYGGKPISDFINTPPSVKHIDKYGKITYSAKVPTTEAYVVWFSEYSNQYHFSEFCSGKKPIFFVDALFMNKKPCPLCSITRPEPFDNTEWIKEYIDILEIKNKYKIDYDDGNLRSVPYDLKDQIK